MLAKYDHFFMYLRAAGGRTGGRAGGRGRCVAASARGARAGYALLNYGRPRVSSYVFRNAENTCPVGGGGGGRGGVGEEERIHGGSGSGGGGSPANTGPGRPYWPTTEGYPSEGALCVRGDRHGGKAGPGSGI